MYVEWEKIICWLRVKNSSKAEIMEVRMAKILFVADLHGNMVATEAFMVDWWMQIIIRIYRWMNLDQVLLIQKGKYMVGL